MNAESVVNNGLPPQEMQLLEAFRAKDFDQVGAVVGDTIAAEEKKQERAKQEYALEIIAIEMIEMLDETIDNFAYNLMKARGESSQWAEERAANDLLHAVTEFMSQSTFTDEPGAEMVKRHHLSNSLFAQEWFDVSPLFDGTLVSTK